MTYLVTAPMLVFAAEAEGGSAESSPSGLQGVLIGAAVTLVASVLVPWVRESLERRRRQREAEARERRDWLMNAITALLAYRQARVSVDPLQVGKAQAEVGTALTQLRVRLKPEEEDVHHVLLVMLAMAQRPVSGVHDMLGQAMISLTNWSRGELKIGDLIADVERRAQIKFAEDRSSALPVKRDES